MRRALAITLALVLVFVIAGTVNAQGGTTHVVSPGENLYRIALRYGTTISKLAEANGIVNPNLILVGQVLVIPDAAGTTPVPTTPTTPGPTPTPPPTTNVHIVARGENLYRIALRYGTTVSTLAAYNNLANPNLIFVGQHLVVPAGGTQPPIVTPVPGTTVTPPPNTSPNVGFAYGVQVHLPNQNQAAVAANVTELGMQWAKQQIEWKVYETSQGNIDWAPIDEMVNTLEAANVHILFSVVKAPAWARELEPGGRPAVQLPDVRHLRGGHGRAVSRPGGCLRNLERAEPASRMEQ